MGTKNYAERQPLRPHELISAQRHRCTAHHAGSKARPPTSKMSAFFRSKTKRSQNLPNTTHKNRFHLPFCVPQKSPVLCVCVWLMSDTILFWSRKKSSPSVWWSEQAANSVENIWGVYDFLGYANPTGNCRKPIARSVILWRSYLAVIKSCHEADPVEWSTIEALVVGWLQVWSEGRLIDDLIQRNVHLGHI